MYMDQIHKIEKLTVHLCNSSNFWLYLKSNVAWYEVAKGSVVFLLSIYILQNSVSVTLLSPLNDMSRTGACVFVREYVNNATRIYNCIWYVHNVIGFMITIVFYGKMIHSASLIIKSIRCVCCCNDNLHGGILDWILLKLGEYLSFQVKMDSG